MAQSVEPWFGLTEQQAIRRGSFRLAAHLVARIYRIATGHDNAATPITSTATADSIVARVARLARAAAGDDASRS